MIVETPRVLLLCLAATTVLGAVMGYCVALIRAKKGASNAINHVRAELSQGKAVTDIDLKSARLSLGDLRSSLADANNRASATLKREEALEIHSQLQAQRIQTLESQVSTYEDQQIRLQRDFATYKSNKSRELELARNPANAWSDADQLPVLNKRIEDDSSQPLRVVPLVNDSSTNSGRTHLSHSSGVMRGRGGLSTPLSRELDIPSLSESELPDSVDGLEFELVDMDDTGALPGG